MCQRCGNPNCPGGPAVPLSVYVPGADPEEQERGICFCIHSPLDPEKVIIELPLAEALLKEGYPVDSKIRAVHFLEELIKKLNEQIDNPQGLVH